MESGYYPAGTEFDPSAPWNRVEDTTAIECDCWGCHTEVENEGDVCAKCLAESEACAPDADVMGLAVPKADHA